MKLSESFRHFGINLKDDNTYQDLGLYLPGPLVRHETKMDNGNISVTTFTIPS